MKKHGRELTESQIRMRAEDRTGRPLILWDDVRFAVELPILVLIAWLVPERYWFGVCRRLEGLKAKLRISDPTRVDDAVLRVLGEGASAQADCPIGLASAARRSEHHLQVLRCARPGGWRGRIVLEGHQNLDAALQAGRGAVLWVAHFAFNTLATKMALRACGYDLWHISRPEHGFSKSRLGIRLFNPIRVRAEAGYLAGRILVDRENPAGATHAAGKVLSRNGIVSITAGAWEGKRVAVVGILGGALELATGAPGLARLTRAALLPVFTVRDDAQGAIRVIVGTPMETDLGDDFDAALVRSCQEFTDQVADYVRAYPDQWRDWKSLVVS